MKLSRQQFETMAVEQCDLLYRVARRLTRDSHQASDLVQETFLRALRAYETFDLQGHGIRPWLVRIMQNLHFSRSGREKRQPVLMDTVPLEHGQRGGTADPFAAQIIGWEGMDERLVRALKELPPDYQVALHLWAVEEFSYKEIADSMDVPIGTVMSRLHRARKKLGELLHDYAIEEGVIRE